MSDWRANAACASADAAAFFGTAAQHHAAKRICARCPVREPCLEDALNAGPSLHGVFGGTDHQERRRILRETPADGNNHEYPAATRTQALDLWTRHRTHYAADWSCAKAIAKQLGPDYKTILTWARTAGLANQPKTRHHTESERDHAINDYLDTRSEHRTVTAALDDVAHRHGIARTALRTWLVAAGVLNPPTHAARPKATTAP